MFVDIAIICPREVEFREMAKLLPRARSLRTARKKIQFSFDVIKGEYAFWNVAVVAPPIGFDSFALWTNAVIQELSPQFLILAGMAGGLKDVVIGDIVIGTSACNYESGKETSQGFAPRARVMVNVNRDFLNLALTISRSLEYNAEGIRYHNGQIASGSKVIAEINSETYKKLKHYNSEALAVEMEAFAFAEAASEAKVQYINIRGISDMIQHKKESDDSGYQEIASARVREFLKPLINSLPKSKPKAIHSFPVKIIQHIYSAREWRQPEIGKLIIYPKLIELVQGQKSMTIRHLKSVSPFKMPGDLATNWVELKFTQRDDEQIFYIALNRKIDLGGWIGGGKKILKALTEFFKNQIQLTS